MDYHADMIVADVVDAHPRAQAVLESFGLPCHRCVVAWSETLAEGLRPHGIEVEVVLERLRAEASPPRPPRRGPR
ncbi:MAG: DUF1858 domain-containing protein [Planctomycetes bacterium]|nr:DUF1858 domain-containing protein [Planctomycetota bacterium]